MVTNQPRRRYESELRAGQAEKTRTAVIHAAAECFSHAGYTATTIATIAARARVSVETVRAHGPKGQLLLNSFEEMSAACEGRSVLDVPEVRSAIGLHDARTAVACIAHASAQRNRHIGRLWQAMAIAAQSDARIARAFDGLQRRIQADIDHVTALLAEWGQLREDLSLEEVAGTAWVLLTPAQYELLVVQAGWSATQYGSWLERMLGEAVLPR